MAGVTEEDIACFEEAFFGEGVGTGVLEVSRLKQWTEAIGVKLSAGILQDFTRKFNAHEIDFQQLMQLIAQRIEGVSDAEELKTAFGVFDRDKNGVITPDEIRALLQDLEERPSQQDIDDIVQAMDVNGDGQIDYDEFVKLMSGH
eukprot:m.358361 g.358361  ORF g.358361 m.358361 type:complete len:145 (-) comp18130_c0_seq1:257-691(-)